jgi:hypothetical protein
VNTLEDSCSSCEEIPIPTSISRIVPSSSARYNEFTAKAGPNGDRAALAPCVLMNGILGRYESAESQFRE